MIVKVVFKVSTEKSGSEVTEEIDLEYPSDYNDKQIYRDIEDVYNRWMWNHIHTDWERKE